MSLTNFVLVLAVVLMAVSLKTAVYVQRRKLLKSSSNLLWKLVFFGSNMFAVLAGLLPFVDAAMTGSQALSGWCKLSLEICALLMVPAVYLHYWFRKLASVYLLLGSFIFLALGAVCCLIPEELIVRRQTELATVTFAGLLYAVWAWMDLLSAFKKNTW